MRVSLALRSTEAAVAGFAVGLLGLFDKGDPGFASSNFMPQVLVAVAVASFHGSAAGAVAIVAAALGTALLPSIAHLIGLSRVNIDYGAWFEAARLPLALGMAAIFVAGTIRDSYAKSVRNLLERIRSLVRRELHARKTNEALAELVDELHKRVAGQRDSVPALYARIRKMDSLDMATVVKGLLDAAVAFSQASSALIYEFDPISGQLLLAATTGPDAEPVLPLEGSLEGWVFRGNTRFTLRSIDDYLGLSRTEAKKSVLAFPVKAGELPWGVLNIREMPFYRYNPNTENDIAIIVDLASAYLRKAVEFRERVLSHPRNAVTGLPGYADFLRVLGEEVALRAGRLISVSVVIAEILGFRDIVFDRSGKDAFLSLKRLAEVASAGDRCLAFHFREDAQLVFILPDIDRNGASLFCLELSESAGKAAPDAAFGSESVEIAFGLSSFAGGPIGQAEDVVGSLIGEAEHVLGLSKSVFALHSRQGEGE
ncbi:MAG TPA: hypothetical protein VMV44_10575 [Rectinemataceae bacterium]|nr:hypothetical protein [Rectinemataceae bacterium]